MKAYRRLKNQDRVFWAAILLALLTAWRLPAAFGHASESQALSGDAFRVVLAAALFFLFREAFSCKDTRLNRIAYAVGLFFSLCTLIGRQMEREGAFAPFSWGSLLHALFTLLLFGAAYGAALVLFYRGALKLRQRYAPADGQASESLYSRLSGNWLVLFLFFLVCWIPVWLAFWPGTFLGDAVTQFFTYLDNVHNTHHPLLHTLLLGASIMFGVDHDMEGSATTGLALYCGIQMIIMAMALACACRWLRQKKAPLAARTAVTLLFALFPFYAIWPFNAQKDILFGGLALMFLLEMADLWMDPEKTLRSPLRILKFIAVSTLMTLMRHNGVYALCLLIPFAIWWAKPARLRIAALLAGCAAAYFLASGALVWITEAEGVSHIEKLSIPLQQIARVLKENPDELDNDTDGVIETLYGFNPGDAYVPQIADPVKWSANSSEIDENLPGLFSLWARLGFKYPLTYLEAFFTQNIPYYLPGTDMLYRFDLRFIQIDMFPINFTTLNPALRPYYEDYDQNLSFLGIPGVRLLSDTAFYVWLCIAALGYALYCRQRQWMACLTFLLAIWVTNLLGPVPLIRYMLGFFYGIPVLLAVMAAPARKPELPPGDDSALQKG